MWKVILIGLVVIGFATAHPPTRERIVTTAAPVLEKLGPVGAFVSRPVHSFAAHSDVEFIVSQIKLASETGRETPRENSLQEWLVTRGVKTRYNGKDPWGKPYYLVRKDKRVTVGSFGPDGVKNTEDDITANGTL